MRTKKESLKKIVSYLNNSDEDGGFWLPNIQRKFVWNEEQICRLFDSIMREYPISTLLVWKTKSEIRHRKFIDNYRAGIALKTLYVPDNTHKKCLVLDGQQRLQSLFIGLCGSYEGRELFFDILSGELAAPDDMKYRFSFLDAKTVTFPWVRFKDIVYNHDDILSLAKQLGTQAVGPLSDAEQAKIARHVSIIYKTFQGDDGISYQELDSTENQQLYGDDDVVEIFIRANSGGTRLGKSDLLFSLLTAAWDNADDAMEELLKDLNTQGFAFNRDFVLKVCLTLLDQGAQYQVSKFRKPEVKDQIEKDWDKISEAIREVHDFVRTKTYIRDDRAMPSYLVLIPLIYLRYRYRDAWKAAQGLEAYLIRSLLTGAFSGTPDRLIDDIVKKINEQKAFDLNQVFDVIRSQGRSLELTPERFWDMGYGSDNVHLLFSLWYSGFNYTPVFDGNLPQVDHIFPQSALKKVKAVNPATGRAGMKYLEAERNQLANCALLTQVENGFTGKTDILPAVWFAKKPDDYLAMHLIPPDRQLWELDHFDDFIAERKKLIQAKFSYLLVDKPSA